MKSSISRWQGGLVVLGVAALAGAASLACIGGGGSSGGAGVLAATSGPGSGPDYTFASYLPLNNGDSYTYDGGATLAVTSTTSETNITGSVFKWAYTDGSDTWGNYLTRAGGATKGSGEFLYTGSSTPPSGRQEVFLQAQQFFPATVKVGQFYTIVAPYTLYPYTATGGVSTVVGTGTYTSKITIVSQGPVITTLGTFPDSLEVLLEYSDTDTIGNDTSGNERYWLAKDVGLVKYTYDDLASVTGAVKTVKLVSGTVGGTAITIPSTSTTKAHTPSPATAGTATSTTPTLSWLAPTGATGTLTYDVRLWLSTATMPTTPTSAAQSGLTYTPTTALTNGSSYNWRVDAIVNAGTPTTGDTWTFTVTTGGTGKATNPNPTNGGSASSTTPTLSWTAPAGVTGTITYDVRLWISTGTEPTTATSAGQSGLSYTPTTALSNGSTYNWRVNTIVNGGTPTQGDLWSFSTPTASAIPTNPRPVDATASSTQYPILKWDAASGAGVTYDVYFDGGVNPPTTRIAQGISATSFDPETSTLAVIAFPLTAATTYYWRVDVVLPAAQTGTVWSFTPGNETTTVTRASTMLPPTTTAGVSLTPVLEWTNPSGATQSEVILDTANPPVTSGGTTTTNAWSPSAPLTASTTYYWRVHVTTANWVSKGPQQNFIAGNPTVTGLHPTTSGTIYGLNSNKYTGVTAPYIYFGAAENGEVPASTGGTTWSQGTKITPAATMRATHYTRETTSGFSAFIVGGAGGKVYFQSGGVTAAWTSASTTDTNDIYDIHGNVTFSIGPPPGISSFMYGVGDNFTILSTSVTVGATTNITFSPVAHGLTNTNHLRGVWSSSASDVLIVGHGGTVLHYTGTWSSAPLTNSAFGTTNFNDVWCDDSALPNKTAYVVGVDKIVEGVFNGTSWTWTDQTAGKYTKVSAGSVETLTAVWGVAANDVWAAGYITTGTTTTSTLLHYNGTAWTRYDGSGGNSHPNISRLESLTGTATGDFYAGGTNGTVLKWNGTTWANVSGQSTEHLADIWGVSNQQVYAAGAAGTILKYNGTTWSKETSGTTNDLNAVDGVDGNNIMAVGKSGTVLFSGGTSWATVAQTATTVDLNDVDMASSTKAWAVGASGTIISATSPVTGTSWAVQTLTGGAITSAFNGVVAISATEAWACGDAANLYHTTDGGTTWTKQASLGTSADLLAIDAKSAGNVVVVGKGGVILKYDGATWSAQTSNTTTDLGAVAAGTNLFYAGGGTATTGTATPVLAENYGTSNWGGLYGVSTLGNIRGIWIETGTTTPDSTLWLCHPNAVVTKFTR